MSIFSDVLDKFNPTKMMKIETGGYANIEFMGFKTVRFKIDGFKDKDNDGNPEFTVSLDVPGTVMDINETVEIPLDWVTGGVFGTIGKVLGLSKDFAAIGESKKGNFVNYMDNLRSAIEEKQ